ncbi:MAG: pre-peptidase C-terminal domain-containing protein, partial [Planktothrix sp.]
NTTLSFSRDLGVLPESLDIRDFVGTDNSTDYYRFTVPSNGEFDLTLGAVTESARVELIKDFNQNGEIDTGDGDIITTGFAGSSLNGNINRAIESGTYYARVYPDSSRGNTNYDLRFRFSPKPSTTPANPGNTLNTALDIGVVGTEPLRFRDFVGYTDPSDIYRFTVNNNSNLNISLSSVTQIARVELIKDFNNNGVIDVGDGDIITRGFAGSSLNSNLNQAVEAGTYYLRVVPDSSGRISTNYDLQISLQPRSASVNTNSNLALNLSNDPLINPRSFNTANESAIQTFAANGSDLSAGLGNETANLLLNDSFTGGNEFANLLANNGMENPDFSQGLALI